MYILGGCLGNQASEPENRDLLGACLKTNHIVIVTARDHMCIANLKHNVRHSSAEKGWHDSVSLQQLT